MAKNSNRGSRNSEWAVAEMARERPLATAAVAAGAAAAGLFLWSRRAQISDQISSLSDQIGEWSENMGSGDGSGEWTSGGSGSTTGSTTGSGRRGGGGARRGMSETGGGNS